MSIFSDDWRDCLREQYKTVVRGVANQTDTRRNQETLESVLYEVGFTDAELHDLARAATMRADDLRDDYVPPEIIAPAVVIEAVEDEPEPEILTHDDSLAEQEPDPEADAPLLANEDDTEAADEAENGDSPQQLSLF